MRSIWKGHIRFLLLNIPVRVYNAIETSEAIHLNQLHKEDYGRIGYDKPCRKCDQVVINEEIIKGYQYATDEYAILATEDLAQVKIKTTKAIDIVGFVEAHEISPSLFDTPYYVGPDGDIAGKSYALLREVMKETGKIGLGKVVLRDREDFVAIAPQDSGLIVYKLRYPNEVRKVTDVPQLEKVQEVDKNELKLAHTLVGQMVTSVSDVEMKDRYKEALRELIEAKIAGKEVAVYHEEEKPTVDILTALKESIKQAERKPMVKATGKTKKAAAGETAKPKPAKLRKAS